MNLMKIPENRGMAEHFMATQWPAEEPDEDMLLMADWLIDFPSVPPMTIVNHTDPPGG